MQNQSLDNIDTFVIYEIKHEVDCLNLYLAH